MRLKIESAHGAQQCPAYTISLGTKSIMITGLQRDKVTDWASHAIASAEKCNSDNADTQNLHQVLSLAWLLSTICLSSRMARSCSNIDLWCSSEAPFYSLAKGTTWSGDNHNTPFHDSNAISWLNNGAAVILLVMELIFRLGSAIACR